MKAEQAPETAPLVFVSGHSHLFRGARLDVVASPPLPVLRPAAVVISFRDGVEVGAELLTGPKPEELALAVPAYRTAAHHPIPEAIWLVTVTAGNLDHLVVKLGQRMS